MVMSSVCDCGGMCSVWKYGCVCEDVVDIGYV